MSVAVVGTPKYPVSDTITVPQNGDALDATQFNTDVETPLIDGLTAARQQLYGSTVQRRVKCTSNTVMVIQPLGAIGVTVSGQWSVKAHTTASTIDPSALSGGLVAATRYYVYASLVAGVVTFTVNTTAPDTGWFYKTASTDHLFITTFFTDNVPDIVTYSQVANRYTYNARTTGGVRGNMVLNAGTAAVITDVNFGSSVPSTATTVQVQVYVTSTEAPANGNVINFSALPSASVDYHTGISLVASTAGVGAGQFEAPFFNSAFSYSVTDNAKDTASAWIAGFTL